MQSLICQPNGVPSLFSAEGAVGIVFLLTLAMVLAGACIAVASRGAVRSQRLVRAVAGLALCFTGLAGVYYFLLSPFLAMMQLLIYVGAISILIAFGIMMARPDTDKTTGLKNPAPLAGPLAFAISLLLFAGLTILAVKTQWPSWPRHASGDTFKEMGIALLTNHALAFELISIVLLVAILGNRIRDIGTFTIQGR